jgi:hypothetical protein
MANQIRRWRVDNTTFAQVGALSKEFQLPEQRVVGAALKCALSGDKRAVAALRVAMTEARRQWELDKKRVSAIARQARQAAV